MKFKLRPGAGKHKIGSETFRAGDVVESHADLAKLLPNKFDRIGGPDPLLEGEEGETPEPSETRTPYDTPQTRKHFPGEVGEEGLSEADLADVEGGQEGDVDETKPAPARRRATHKGKKH